MYNNNMFNDYSTSMSQQYFDSMALYPGLSLNYANTTI